MVRDLLQSSATMETKSTETGAVRSAHPKQALSAREDRPLRLIYVSPLNLSYYDLSR